MQRCAAISATAELLYEILLTDSDRKMTEWQCVTEAEFKAKDVSVQKLQLLVNWIVLI